ncbi:MAG: BrnA antitoxin family protein [Candidatus Hydrogenedentes bacterium]|nr:BrnA antitoxin family protein [Candidatus Hydrogenedentota bacterium]
MPDNEIDLGEAPEIDPRVFKRMEVRLPKPKELVSIRIDPDVLGWFRKQGRGYQTRINAVLRSYIEAQSR